MKKMLSIALTGVILAGCSSANASEEISKRDFTKGDQEKGGILTVEKVDLNNMKFNLYSFNANKNGNIEGNARKTEKNNYVFNKGECEINIEKVEEGIRISENGKCEKEKKGNVAFNGLYK